MKNIYFDNYCDFASDITDKFITLADMDCDIAVIAKYEAAKKIINELLYAGFELSNVTLDHEYLDEYIISIVKSNDRNEIWCEPMKKEHGYISDYSAIIFLLDNCSSTVIPFCKSKFVYEVSIGETYENKIDCNTQDGSTTYISKSKDGVPEGFTKSWTSFKNGVSCCFNYSYYSSDIDILRKIAARFGVNL